MNTPSRAASSSFALAVLALSSSVSAQTVQPPQQQPAPAQAAAPQPQAAPAPVARAPGSAPAPMYRPAQPTMQPAPMPAPGQAYPAYDPNSGQMVLVAPYIPAQRMPPKELSYSENRPVPPGYAVEEYHPRGLIIGGAITLGTLWAISFSVASSNDYKDANGWLAVPVIGPFGWLATRKTPRCTQTDYYSSCDNNESGNRTMVAFDALGQVAGATMLIAGLAITRKRLVLVDPQAAFSVVPYASSRGSGLQLIGRF